MSAPGKQAKRAVRDAEFSAAESRNLRLGAEDRLRKEKEKSQRLFIRQLRSRLGGGFFESSTRETLG